jgi:hypothetical protein
MENPLWLRIVFNLMYGVSAILPMRVVWRILHVPWSCQDCGRLYGDKGWLDVIIPDEQWQAIGMPNDGGGLLCVDCTVKRGAKLPNVTHAHLEFQDD